MQTVGKGHQAEFQADGFSFECWGCGKMKGLEIEMEQLRQLVVAGGRWEGKRWVVPLVPVEEQQRRRRERRCKKTGGKGDKLMGEREMDNVLPGDTIAGQNATKWTRVKSYSEVVIEGVRRRTLGRLTEH